MMLSRKNEHMDWDEIRALLKKADVKLKGTETHAELLVICGIKTDAVLL